MINGKLIRTFPGKGDLYEGNFIACHDCKYAGTMETDIDMEESEIIVMCPECSNIIGTIPQSAESETDRVTG